MNNSGSGDKDRIIEQLQVENDLKTKWISLLIHDFRGLFSNVQWLLNAYQNKVIPEELFLQMLPEVNQQIEMNQRTFLDTCEWVRARADGAEIIASDMNVLHLFVALKMELKPLWIKKDITLNFTGDSTLSLRSDQVLVRFILHKIVENAIKYSYNRGSIEFEARRNASGLQIRVKDDGVGMKPSVLESLFTLNGNPCTGTENEKGVGLSLVVVNDFMNRLGGKLEVFSEENSGTVFELLFPIKE